MSAALTRWNAFLAQIQGRHDQVRRETEAGARQFIANIAGGGDYLPLSHQLMAVRSRLQELETTITATWHAKVSDAIDAEDLGIRARDRAFEDGEALRHALDDLREELEIRILAELARQRFTHAVATTRGLTCQACGATGTAPVTFRAVQLVCTSCGAGVLFDPGELMRSVAAVGTHALAQEGATPQWRAMVAAGRALTAMRPPRTLDVIAAYEASQIAYWRAYLALRSQFEPEMGRDPEMEIRSRMDQWYRSSAEYEEAWVAAGRPRQI